MYTSRTRKRRRNCLNFTRWKIQQGDLITVYENKPGIFPGFFLIFQEPLPGTRNASRRNHFQDQEKIQEPGEDPGEKIKSFIMAWIKKKTKKSQGLKHNRRSEGRNIYNSRSWQKIRDSIFLRDKGICKMCFCAVGIKPKDYAVDHIKPVKNEGSFTDPENLQLLCASCHAKKSQKEKR